MTKKVTSSSAVIVVLTVFWTIGSAIYFAFMSRFNFGEVTSQITTSINYVFDLLFSSLGLLGFFIRPRTLSYICRLFCFYWILHFEFKFMIVCIKLTIRLYEVVKDLLNKSSNAIMNIFNVS